MLHIVPILCLIFFIFFVEYRLKNHIDCMDRSIKEIQNNLKEINDFNTFISSKLIHNESNSNE